MDEEGRVLRVWLLYGRFCGLMVCGSCFGAVTWTARMIQLRNYFISEDASSRGDLVQKFSLLAISRSWSAVFWAMYAVEFLCLVAAKLMVLDRMSDFAAGRDEGTRKRWAAGGRIVMAVVVLGNSVGLAGNVAVAVQFQRSAEAASTASALFAANSTQAALESASLSRKGLELAVSISAVQLFCEVTVLLLIVAAFVVTGVACARIVSSRLRLVDAASASAATGREIRWKMVITTMVVFVAFVIRSVQSIINALSRQLQDLPNQCPGLMNLCDSICYNVFTHIHYWNVFTPEFQVTIVLVSSPLTLLVALWGMTSRQALHAMKSKEQDAPLRMLPLPPQSPGV
jgi:hypothetical protein